ncbi:MULTISPECIES: rhodanese-like domain-containing protein [Testudinibacter]|uniref:Rhodanese-like domain-containing protein n=1 Tax=Testudinibacter aquarius TaxID=1524974 RepID=A0A4R3XUI8_9PAST|nr:MULTISPECIES: rhodanese-like domain-containing protein [Testudinibacter]TNH07035.1 rhodanese-like domain-containing protein [Pasteurellaceae bacterium Phil11]KAE9530998.1 rhodanese-like domain-containing protein [Testudinibacter aquarius]TCV83355.1 rhodanese-related sulfurtransferase [Testudinibacter aquarius]TNG91185.1 rhodanese-like domain-containing protein [Testudinibacter aquarius]TNH21776.1 rhodanese-like domain-containing protein [Testudinibacter sp. TR-2022]
MEDFIPKAVEFAGNHTIMVVAWVVVFIGVIVTFAKSATSAVKVINNMQLTQLINKEHGVVVDVRSNDEFKRGHIIGSVQALPSEIKNRTASILEKHKAVPVIVVDASGLGSEALANQLHKQGFAQVYSLKEGIGGWRGANLPLVKH